MGTKSSSKGQKIEVSTRKAFIYLIEPNDVEISKQITEEVTSFIFNHNKNHLVHISLATSLSAVKSNISLFVICLCPISKVKSLVEKDTELNYFNNIIAYSTDFKVNHPEKIFKCSAKITDIIDDLSTVKTVLRSSIDRLYLTLEPSDPKTPKIRSKQISFTDNISFVSETSNATSPGIASVSFKSEDFILFADMISCRKAFKSTAEMITKDKNVYMLMKEVNIDKETDVFRVFEFLMKRYRLDDLTEAESKLELVNSLTNYFTTKATYKAEALNLLENKAKSSSLKNLRTFCSDIILLKTPKSNKPVLHNINKSLRNKDYSLETKVIVNSLMANTCEEVIDLYCYKKSTLTENFNELTSSKGFFVCEFVSFSLIKPETIAGDVVFSLRVKTDFLSYNQPFILKPTLNQLIVTPFSLLEIEKHYTKNGIHYVSLMLNNQSSFKRLTYYLRCDFDELMMEIKTSMKNERDFKAAIQCEFEFFENYYKILSNNYNHNDDYNVEVAETLEFLAQLQFVLGKTEDSFNSIKIATELKRQEFSEESAKHINCNIIALEFLIKSKNFEDAKELFNSIDSKYSSVILGNPLLSLKVHLIKAEMLESDGNFTSAIAVLQTAESLQQLTNSNYLAYRMNMIKGRLLIEIENYDKALVQLSTAVTFIMNMFGPESTFLIEIYSKVGEIYRRKKDDEAYKKMIQKATQVVKVTNPDETAVFEYFSKLGLAAYEEDNKVAAIEWLSQAVKAYPSNAGFQSKESLNQLSDVHFKLGRLYFSQSNFVSAQHHLFEASQLRQTLEAAYWEACSLIEMQSYESALDKFELVLKLNGSEDYLLMNDKLFMIYFELKNYEEALFFCDKSIQKCLRENKKKEKNVENEARLAFLLKGKGETFIKQKEFNKAKETLYEARHWMIKLDEIETAEIDLLIAQLCSKMNLTKEAKRQILDVKRVAEAETLIEMRVKALNLEGDLLMKEEDVELAERRFEEALDLSKAFYGINSLNVGLAYNNLGNAELKLGNLKAASEFYLQARDIFSAQGKKNLVKIVDSNLEKTRL